MSVAILWAIFRIIPPITGGELRFENHLEYLLGEGAKVRIGNWPRRRYGFIFGPLINNYWILKEILGGQETIIVEQSMDRDVFVLGNWAAKIIRRVKIVIFVLEIPEENGLSKTRLARRRFLFSLFLRSADAVIVASKYTRRWVLTHGVGENHVHIIPDSTRVHGDNLLARVKQNSPIKILSVAHIRPNKGQKYLIEALRHIKNEDFIVFVAGAIKDCVYFNRISAMIKDYGLDNKVNFMGMLSREELTRAYAEADIFVLPTLREGYGQVVAEAMSFGLPIVASNVGAIPELVTDGVEGLLVPPADPGSLKLALQRLILDERLRRTLGENARAKAKILPTWNEVNEQFYKVLMSLI